MENNQFTSEERKRLKGAWKRQPAGLDNFISEVEREVGGWLAGKALSGFEQNSKKRYEAVHKAAAQLLDELRKCNDDQREILAMQMESDTTLGIDGFFNGMPLGVKSGEYLDLLDTSRSIGLPGLYQLLCALTGVTAPRSQKPGPKSEVNLLYCIVLAYRDVFGCLPGVSKNKERNPFGLFIGVLGEILNTKIGGYDEINRVINNCKRVRVLRGGKSA